jgi:hypothetical protein
MTQTIGTKDIIERLEKWVDTGHTPDVLGLVQDAMSEIERLRSMVGAVSDGESFADLKARLPPQSSNHTATLAKIEDLQQQINRLLLEARGAGWVDEQAGNL